MQTSFSGIILGGGIQLDQRVDLADQSRVHVTIVPVRECQTRWNEALEALRQLRSTNPIGSSGARFTREQLHERG